MRPFQQKDEQADYDVLDDDEFVAHHDDRGEGESVAAERVNSDAPDASLNESKSDETPKGESERTDGEGTPGSAEGPTELSGENFAAGTDEASAGHKAANDDAAGDDATGEDTRDAAESSQELASTASGDDSFAAEAGHDETVEARADAVQDTESAEPAIEEPERATEENVFGEGTQEGHCSSAGTLSDADAEGDAAAVSAATPELSAESVPEAAVESRSGEEELVRKHEEPSFAPVSVPVAEPADSADSALTADEAATDIEAAEQANELRNSLEPGHEGDQATPVRRRSAAHRQTLRARTLRDMLMGSDEVSQAEQLGESSSREKDATESGPEHPVRLDGPRTARHRAGSAAACNDSGSNPAGHDGPSDFAQSAFEQEQSRRRAEQLLWESSAPHNEGAAKRSRLISESSAATFSSEAVAEAAEEDLVSPAGRLIAISQRHGAPFTVVWRQRRRNINLKARITPWGTIVLSDGRVFTDPTAAARKASGMDSVDGWRVWRIPGGKRLGDL